MLPVESGGVNDETTTWQLASTTVEEGTTKVVGVAEKATIGPSTFIQTTTNSQSECTLRGATFHAVSGTFTNRCSYLASAAISPLPESWWSSYEYEISISAWYNRPETLILENWPARHAVCTVDNAFLQESQKEVAELGRRRRRLGGYVYNNFNVQHRRSCRCSRAWMDGQSGRSRVYRSQLAVQLRRQLLHQL